MSFASLTRHTAYIIRYDPSGEEDEWLQPESGERIVATVKMHVEPTKIPMGRTFGVEESTTHDVGGTLNDYTVYMRLADVTEADRIQHVQADCIAAGFARCELEDVTYRVRQVRDGAGRHHHLEIDCRLHTPIEDETASG